MSLPAFCPNCGLNFWAENAVKVTGPGTAELYLEGNTTDCPRCHYRYARIGDGLFALTTDAVRLLKGPAATAEVLRRLRGIFEEAQRAKDTPQSVAAKVEEVSPGIARILRTREWTPADWFAFLALMWMISTYLIDSRASPPSEVHHHTHYHLSSEEIVREAARVVEEGRETPLSPQTWPAPPVPQPNPKRERPTAFQKAERVHEAHAKPDHGGVPEVKAKHKRPPKPKRNPRRRGR